MKLMEKEELTVEFWRILYKTEGEAKGEENLKYFQLNDTYVTLRSSRRIRLLEIENGRTDKVNWSKTRNNESTNTLCFTLPTT